MSETSRTMLDYARDALNARMTKDNLRLVLENVITYADTLRARLDDVHRTPQDQLTPAEVRLGQYAQPPRTFASDTERALFQIACGLRDSLEETRDQRNSARLKVMGLEARVAELVARLAEYERPADEDPITFTLTEQADAVCAEDDVTPQVAKLRALLADQREQATREADDPARCLEVHPFSPRDGWRMVCGNCDHGKDASCHKDGAE
ncbi:hypothetical protein ACFVIN_01470 [Streptomyces prasinus]|uniref:hypothetical protein n=1 Tax=Streptomyces prasinus TaxID=67345 RepID=UPI00363BB54B